MDKRDMKSYRAELEIVSVLLKAAKGVEAKILQGLASSLQDLCNLYMEVYADYYNDDILNKKKYQQLEYAFNTGKHKTYVNYRIKTICKQVNDLQQTELRNWFLTEYQWVADMTATSLQSGYNPTPRSTQLKKKQMQASIKESWCEDHRTYVDRINYNMQDMEDKIAFVFLQSLRNNWRIDKSSKKLRTVVGVATSKATRLLRTESMAVYSKATKEVFLNNGVQYVSIIGDAECGTICTEYVDEMIPLETARLGLELPPYHPNCACCYCANGAFGDIGDLGYGVD